MFPSWGGHGGGSGERLHKKQHAAVKQLHQALEVLHLVSGNVPASQPVAILCASVAVLHSYPDVLCFQAPPEKESPPTKQTTQDSGLDSTSTFFLSRYQRFLAKDNVVVSIGLVQRAGGPLRVLDACHASYFLADAACPLARPAALGSPGSPPQQAALAAAETLAKHAVVLPPLEVDRSKWSKDAATHLPLRRVHRATAEEGEGAEGAASGLSGTRGPSKVGAGWRLCSAGRARRGYGEGRVLLPRLLCGARACASVVPEHAQSSPL